MCIFTSIDYVRMGTKKSVIVEFVYSGGTVDELLHVNNASKREGNMFNSYNHLEDNCLFDNEINNSIFRNNSNGHQCNQQSSGIIMWQGDLCAYKKRSAYIYHVRVAVYVLVLVWRHAFLKML